MMVNNNITSYIGVGSNIQPEENIVKALKLLFKKVQVIGISTFYRTKAISNENQSDYLNGVWKIKTNINPEELKFAILKNIEDTLKRVKTGDKYSSRTIDLDILLYGNEVLENANIKIPDPDIYKRSFVAYPLYELTPHLIIPDTGRSIRSITEALNNDDMVMESGFTERLKKELIYLKKSHK